MKKIKPLGVAIVAVVALSAIASATAPAALPEFLPGNAGEKATGTSPSDTLEINSLEKITCTSGLINAEIIGSTKKEASAILTLKGCIAFGIAGAKSLGEPEGTIAEIVFLKLCYINKAKKEVGMLSKIAAPVHVEVAGKLMIWEGDQIGKIAPINVKTAKFTIKYEESAGVPKPEGCEGEKEHLTVSINEGAPKQLAQATIQTLTFEHEQTIDA